MSIPSGAKDHLLLLLQTAKNRLEYLTRNDWILIVDKARAINFKKDEVLIAHKRFTRKVYLLAKGTARIEGNARVRISKIGPGEVCGEMSFLESREASASVIAEEEVEAYAIDWAALQELFELFPHLASRFYQSLAVNLSRRVREQNAAR